MLCIQKYIYLASWYNVYFLYYNDDTFSTTSSILYYILHAYTYICEYLIIFLQCCRSMKNIRMCGKEHTNVKFFMLFQT